MKDLKKRVLAHSITIPAALILILFSTNPIISWAVFLAVSFLAITSIWEYAAFTKAKGVQIDTKSLFVITPLLLLSYFLFPYWLPSVVFALGALFLCAKHFQKIEGSIQSLACSFFSLIYVAVPLGMLLAILYGLPGFGGLWWTFYLIAVTKITDVGAYFGGKLFGKRKLAPKISPGKTIEGAVAGILFALITSFLFYQFAPAFLGPVEWVVFGILFAVVGQFGDLFESLLKRDAGKKDSSALAGFGGALDLLDSLLFNAPILYLYLNYPRMFV